MNPIVEKNLEKMTVSKRGSMIFQLMKESIGGNAGTWEGLSCRATNFVYDNQTGKIFVFTNNAYELIPRLYRAPEIKRKLTGDLVEGTYRIAVDNKKRHRTRIISLRTSSNTADLARETLEETVRVYNERFGPRTEVALGK